jgi:hypothetical protein
VVIRTGDYSDVKVIDAEGREIPWNQESHINQAEMKMLITGRVNRIHTFLARPLFLQPKTAVGRKRNFTARAKLPRPRG